MSHNLLKKLFYTKQPHIAGKNVLSSEEQRKVLLEEFKTRCSPQQNFEHVLWAAFNSFITYKGMDKLTVYKTEVGESSPGSSMYSWDPYWKTFDVIADNIYLFSVRFKYSYSRRINSDYILNWIEIHCYNPITKTTGIRLTSKNYNIYNDNAETPLRKLEYELEHTKGICFGATAIGAHILDCADSANDTSTRSALMFLRNPKSQPNIVRGTNSQFDNYIENKEKEAVKKINPLSKHSVSNGVIRHSRTRIM